jgi:hypothetical protein
MPFLADATVPKVGKVGAGDEVHHAATQARALGIVDQVRGGNR